MRHVVRIAVVALCAGSSPIAHGGGPFTIDQIGPAPFFPTATSSSQFPPGQPESAVTTVDNFVLTVDDPAHQLRIRRIDAAVAGLPNFGSFDAIESWTLQVYSTVKSTVSILEGDVHSQSFDAPALLSSGFATFAGQPVEVATFVVDFEVPAGEYWLAVVMENDNEVNGIVGIAGSSFGDGPAIFSGPGLPGPANLGNPAGYRISGVTVTCPADVNEDDTVDVDDLVAVITAWNTDDEQADVDLSGAVDVDDLLAVILAWGDC